MSAKHHATEQMQPEQAVSLLPETCRHLDKLMARLRVIRQLPADARLLDIGAAQGLLLIAAGVRGIRAVGIEPWGEARRVAEQLAGDIGAQITIIPGGAEQLPIDSESFDIVHANSVIEHVLDPQAMLDEAFRVLKPGGMLWFCTASSRCPRQREISGFPCFGWYPQWIKMRIMAWAKRNRPHLIGHTQTPAINWFTPRKARRMLHRAGFGRVWDRWDLRLNSEGGRAHRLALRAIRCWPVGKFVADVLVSACAFAAVKEQ